jgi:hypothetical protein
MKRALVLASACVFLVGLSGCSNDPRDAEIKRMVAHLGEAADDVKSVADAIKEAVKKSKADPEKKNLTENELKPAFEAIDRFKVLGEKFKAVKSKIDSFVDLPTEEQKKGYIRENKADLERGLDRLDTEQRNLEVVLESATPDIDRNAMVALRKKLREAEEVFLSLGQRQ